MPINFLRDADISGRLDVASDIRLRGSSSSLDIGVVRLYCDASSNFSIDPLNNGSNLFNVTSAGNVGVGVNPTGRLHVFNSSSTEVKIEASTDDASMLINSGTDGLGVETSYIYFADNSTNKWFIGKDTGNDFIVYDTARGASAIEAFTNGDLALMQSGGNVGIGITSPAKLLHLQNSAPAIRIQDSDGTNQWAQITEGNGALSIVSRNNTTAGVINLQTYDGTTTLNTVTLKAGNQVQFNQYGSGTYTGTATQRLAVDSSGNIIEIPIGSGAIDGLGVANKLAFFSDTDTIEDTTLHWDSANGRLGVGVTVPSYPVDIQSELDMGGGTFHYDHTNKRIGINTISPDTKLEVNGETKTKNLSYASTTATNQYHGEIVTFGTFVGTGTPGNNGAIAEGDVIVYTTNGLASGWTRAQGSTTFGKGMLGIAMGTSPSDGILIKGFARNTAFASGGLGDPLYLDASNAGDTTNSAPSATNNIVRIVGYMLNSTNDEIFFDPDKSWVQIS